MTAIIRCESCPAEREAVSESNRGIVADWISLESYQPAMAEEDYAYVPDNHDFCSWKCLAEYAAARSLIDSAGESS
jgi:hypothetical protein